MIGLEESTATSGNECGQVGAGVVKAAAEARAHDEHHAVEKGAFSLSAANSLSKIYSDIVPELQPRGGGSGGGGGVGVRLSGTQNSTIGFANQTRFQSSSEIQSIQFNSGFKLQSY